MKLLFLVLLAVSTLSGCTTIGDILPTSKMGAAEIFRGAADNGALPSWAKCKVPTNTTGTNTAEVAYGGDDKTTRIDGQSITRAFICAMQAEHDAYPDEISRITKRELTDGKSAGDKTADTETAKSAANTKAEKGTESDTDRRVHLLYWQLNLASDAIAVANMNCDYHFRDTELQRANFEFSQGALNTVASALGAGLAALNSHNRAIFNLATTATATNSIASHYKSAVFLTPLLRKLHKQLDLPRQKVAAAIRDELTLEKMPRVMLLKAKLVEYEQLCSRESLVEILSQAIDIPRYEAPEEISIQSQNEAKQLTAELAKSAKTTGTKLTPKILKSLAIIGTISDREAVIAALKASKDQTQLGGFAALLFADKTADESIRKLTRIMVNLKYDDDADLGTIKAALVALAKAAADKKADATKSEEATKAAAAAVQRKADSKTIEAANKEADTRRLKLEQTTKLFEGNAVALVQLLDETKTISRRKSSASNLENVRVRIFAMPPTGIK